MSFWDALTTFLSQPFGAAGAVAIMAAVTVVNSQRLRDRLDRGNGVDTLFNSLNLIGGICLFINAVVRDEVVWLILETYFVAIAIKGLTQRKRHAENRTDAPVLIDAREKLVPWPKELARV